MPSSAATRSVWPGAARLASVRARPFGFQAMTARTGSTRAVVVDARPRGSRRCAGTARGLPRRQRSQAGWWLAGEAAGRTCRGSCIVRLRVDHVDVGLGVAAGTVAVVAGPGGVDGNRRVGAQRPGLERPVRAVRAACGQGVAGVAEGLRPGRTCTSQNVAAAWRGSQPRRRRSGCGLGWGSPRAVRKFGDQASASRAAGPYRTGGQRSANQGAQGRGWRRRLHRCVSADGVGSLWIISCVLLEGWWFPSRSVRARKPPVKAAADLAAELRIRAALHGGVGGTGGPALTGGGRGPGSTEGRQPATAFR